MELGRWFWNMRKVELPAWRKFCMELFDIGLELCQYILLALSNGKS